MCLHNEWWWHPLSYIVGGMLLLIHKHWRCRFACHIQISNYGLLLIPSSYPTQMLIFYLSHKYHIHNILKWWRFGYPQVIFNSNVDLYLIQITHKFQMIASPKICTVIGGIPRSSYVLYAYYKWGHPENLLE